MQKTLFGERPFLKRFKETNGRPKHTERSTVVNAGSPNPREWYGDGAAIVVRTGEESKPVHGEGRQVLLRKRKGRYV